MTLPYELLYAHRLHHESTRCPLELANGLQVEGPPPQMTFGSHYWCELRSNNAVSTVPSLLVHQPTGIDGVGVGSVSEPGAAVASGAAEAVPLDANARDTSSKASSAETLPLLLAAATPSQSSGSSSSSHDADAPAATPASVPPLIADMSEACAGAEASAAPSSLAAVNSAATNASAPSATSAAAVVPPLAINFYFMVPRLAGLSKACKEYAPGAHDLHLIQYAIMQPLLDSLRIIANRSLY